MQIKIQRNDIIIDESYLSYTRADNGWSMLTGHHVRAYMSYDHLSIQRFFVLRRL